MTNHQYLSTYKYSLFCFCQRNNDATTISITTFSIMTLSITIKNVTLSINDSERKWLSASQYRVPLFSVILLSVAFFIVICYAECHHVEFSYDEYHYAECRGALATDEYLKVKKYLDALSTHVSNFCSPVWWASDHNQYQSIEKSII